MIQGPLLTTAPLPGWVPEPRAATAEQLPGAAALLVPHDGEPVADVQGRPGRWAQLALITQAGRRRVPVLAWGTGAALAGRALGASIRIDRAGLSGEWAAPRGAVVQRWRGELPLLWQAGSVTAWAGITLPGDLRDAFLRGLADAGPRAPATPLEALGGEGALRRVLQNFYARARADDLLGPVFAAHVTDWDAHLERVTAFWVTLLGGGTAWRGNLNGVHGELGLKEVHLARWLALFGAAAREQLPPEAAARLIDRAGAMGARLGRRRERGNPPPPQGVG